VKSRPKKSPLDGHDNQKRATPSRVATHAWICTALVILTATAFFPVLQNDFVIWDDVDNYLNNPDYRGLSPDHLRWMFTTFHHSLYRPATWITLGFDYLLWGMDPFGYHLTSLIFHLANAVLFYLVALRVFQLIWSHEPELDLRLQVGAAVAALLFSLHPLRVEPVAWASGRENLVSAFFFLLTFLCYLNAVDSRRDRFGYWSWMIATWAVYGLSLLSKAAGMTLPFALVVLDIYPLRRLGGDPRQWFRPQARRLFWEKLPFLLLAVAAGIAAILAKQQEQAIQTLDKYTPLVRLADSFYGLAFYLWKTLAPFGLSPLYQLPVEPDPLAWPFVLSLLVVFTLTALLFHLRRRWPAGLAAWAFYVITLVPVLGFVQYGLQIAADRYSYLACLSWAVLGGAGAVYAQKRRRSSALGKRVYGFCCGLACAMLVALSFLTWQQAKVWKDSERLWRYALSVDPESSFAYHMLAIAVHEKGRIDEVIELYQKSLSLDPNFVYSHLNLAGFLEKKENHREAAYHYRRVIDIDPKGPATTYYKLANSHFRQGNFAESIKYYHMGLARDPMNAAAHNDLANVFAAKGDLENAHNHYRRATELDPKMSGPYFNLVNLLIRQDKIRQAILLLRRAAHLIPDSALAYNTLGRLLAAEGQLDEAISYFREAVQLEPGLAEAHENLVLALTQQGKKEQALQHYHEALRIQRNQREGQKAP